MRGSVLAVAVSALLGIATVQTAQAGIIYGINDANDGLYAINTASGSSSLLYDLGTFGSNSPNGLAHDIAGKAFYFTTFSNNPASLFKLDYGSTGLNGDPASWVKSTITTNLPGPNASGAFYGGSYYWWAQGSESSTSGEDNGLFKIDPVSKVITNILTTDRGTFGDIEIRSDGRLFVSNNSSFSIYNLNDLALPPITITQMRMQLALGSDGVLYGVQTDSASGFHAGSIFTIDQNTGVRTFTGKTTSLSVNDTARAVPEPGTLAVLGAGLLALAFGLRRRARDTYRSHARGAPLDVGAVA